jgi:predicted nucleotidyltransferase
MKTIQWNENLFPELISEDIFEHIINCGLSGNKEFQPTLICLVGSRVTGNYKEDSDIDIAIQYQGNLNEHVVFNILNERHLYIDGLKVDFIPYSEFKGNCIDLKPGTFISIFNKTEMDEDDIEEVSYQEEKMERFVAKDNYLRFVFNDLTKNRNLSRSDALRILFNSNVLEDSDMIQAYKLA